MFFSLNIHAQYTIQHQVPIAIEREQPTELEFVVPGISQNSIQQARLFYRYDGQFAYQQKEIQFQNGAFIAPIKVQDQSASSIEYYLEVTLLSGERFFYPDNDPAQNPVRVQIIDKVPDKEMVQLQNIDYTILSPKPGTALTPDDALLAIALFYNPSEIGEGEFRLYLDDIDVTQHADTGDYYISFASTGLRTGPHQARLSYLSDKKEFLVTEWDFFIVQPGQSSYQAFDDNRNRPSVMAELAARNQVIAGDINNAYTGRARISGSYGLFKYSINSYLTSQESSRLQPQNRYGVNLELGKWWKFEAGHVYPNMSDFTISGRRIYGINSSLHLLWENLNFQVIYGELDRSIPNLYGGLTIDSVKTTNGAVVDTTYTLTYQNRGRGTFRRNITGGRVGFGKAEKFQLGFHVMKVQDDTTSIYNIRDYFDFAGSQTTIGSNLSPSDRIRLQQNPDLLTIEGGTARPKDNLVAGADLKFGLHDNRIRFESEAVVSALNDNIYNGTITAERLEELGFDIDQEILDLLDQLSWLIIVNENMNTLPLRAVEDENGETNTETYFPTSILAGNSELSFRYPRNNLRIQYRWIGPDFNSLANSTIRKDIAGYTVTDRFNLFSNRFYLTLGYESLTDNLAGKQEATTQTLTYRSNASWYPVNKKLPRVNLGFRYRTRDNSVQRFNPQVPVTFEHAAVRNIRISENGDTLTTATPRLSKTLNIHGSITQQLRLLNSIHDLSLNISNMETIDEVFAFGDVNSSAISVNLTSRFTSLPLRTQFGTTINNTTTGSGQSEISIFGLYAGGNFFLFNDKLSVNGRFAITSTETTSKALDIENSTDDNPYNDYFVLGASTANAPFTTFAIQFGAQYNINDHHSLLFDARLTNVNDNNQANDRVAEFRYVLRF